MRARFLAHTFGLVIYPPRARGDRVRAFTAPLGPSTAAPRFENGGRRHLHRLKNHRGYDLVESSRSGALVAPRGALIDCKRPGRVTRRGSRSNGGEFALEGAAGAMTNARFAFSCAFGGVRWITRSVSLARLVAHPDHALADVRISALGSPRVFSRRLRARELRVDAPKLQ